MDSQKVGAFIAQLRKEKGLTQSSLAEQLSLSNRTVSKWENGDGYPDITILPDLATLLGVSVDELLKGERKENEAELKPLFTVEGETKRKEFIQQLRVYQSRRIPLYSHFAIQLFASSLVISLYYIGIHINNGVHTELLNKVLSVYFVVLAIQVFAIAVYPYLVYRSLIASNGGKILPSKLTVDEKTIHYENGIKQYTVGLDEITEFIISERHYLILCGKKILFTLSKDDVNDKPAFEALIKGHSKTVVNHKKPLRIKLISALVIIGSLFLLASVARSAYISNDKYFYRDIFQKTSYYFENEAEFGNAQAELDSFYTENKNAIDKEIADEDYADYLKEDFKFKINNTDYVNYYPDGVSLEAEDNLSYVCGYLYSKKEGIPELTDFGYDEYYGKLKETYIKEDNIYLYGKTKNGTLSKDPWYLIAPLENNWYYFEVHY